MQLDKNRRVVNEEASRMKMAPTLLNVLAWRGAFERDLIQGTTPHQNKNLCCGLVIALEVADRAPGWPVSSNV
jgi:hypothetical protein